MGTATTIYQAKDHSAIAVSAGHVFSDPYHAAFLNPPGLSKHIQAEVLYATRNPDVAILRYNPGRRVAVAPLGVARDGDEYAVRGFAYGRQITTKYVGRIKDTREAFSAVSGTYFARLETPVAQGVSGAGVIVGGHTVAVVSAADHEETVAVPARVVYEVAQRRNIWLGSGST